MATIALRPSLFSLVITFVSVLTELGLLSALLRFNTLLQCRRLSRGATISIARHRRCNTLVALLSMALFVLIELLASAHTVTVFSTQSVNQPCTQLSPLLPGRSDRPGAEVALYSCLQVNGSLFSVFAANHSSVDDTVLCEESFAFRYQNLQRDLQTLSGAGVMRCVSSPPFDVCAIARARSRTLFVSEPFERPAEGVDQSQQLLFLPTELSFLAEPHLDFFALRAAEAFEATIIDEFDLRRRIIMGSQPGNCSFTSMGSEQSQIPNAMLGITVAVWIISLLLLVLSLLFRGAVYFDMNNQMHWANRARRAVDDETKATSIKFCPTPDGSGGTIYLIDKHESSA